MIVSLLEARAQTSFGGKAVALGEALRCELPVPPGFALSSELVTNIQQGESDAWHRAEEVLRPLLAHSVAVRSSGVGEDAAGASFAGMHETVVGVVGPRATREAIVRVAQSANSEVALDYRRQLGIDGAPRMGVVVQACVAAEAAGVMFTKCPLTGADHRIIEAAWGLGESVVAGLVAPDSFRMEPGGRILERTSGEKPTAMRLTEDGRCVTAAVPPQDIHRLCLDDAQLGLLDVLAERCDAAFGSRLHDIEWAFSGDCLYLLQRRPITR